jgi:hypothetical protein
MPFAPHEKWLCGCAVVRLRGGARARAQARPHARRRRSGTSLTQVKIEGCGVDVGQKHDEISVARCDEVGYRAGCGRRVTVAGRRS